MIEAREEARAMLKEMTQGQPTTGMNFMSFTHGQEKMERAAIEKFKQSDNFKVAVHLHISVEVQKAMAEHKLDELHCEASYLMTKCDVNIAVCSMHLLTILVHGKHLLARFKPLLECTKSIEYAAV